MPDPGGFFSLTGQNGLLLCALQMLPYNIGWQFAAFSLLPLHPITGHLMSIVQDIAAWDGKSADDIAAIYQRHCDDTSLSAKLIKSMRQVALQKGASWLLKKHMESGHSMACKQAGAVFQCLPELQHWESKLHILQCLPYMPIADTDKKRVAAFLHQCLSDNNKFVRAWAYNGFYELAVRHPEYAEQTKQFFDLALKDEAASVKARIRNIVKKKAFKQL